MNKSTESVNDNWDCEYLAIMILRQQEADEDNREVYRVQKCRMKKELNDMAEEMKSKGQLKRKRIIKSIIEIAREFEEPMKLRDEKRHLHTQIRELKKLLDTTEEYWTQKVREKMRDEYSKARAESDLKKELESSREVNRRIMDAQTQLEGRLYNIQNNFVLTPKDEHAEACQTQAQLVLEAHNNKSTTKDKTIKQLRKKNKKLEKQIAILKSFNSDSSSSSEEEEQQDDSSEVSST